MFAKKQIWQKKRIYLRGLGTVVEWVWSTIYGGCTVAYWNLQLLLCFFSSNNELNDV